jgi:hydrogenase maturation protease
VTARVLIAGVGNELLGDDGFGPAVARALFGARWPEGVEVTVRDVGLRGRDLAFEIAAGGDPGWDLLIVVDTVATGAPPGTVRRLSPTLARSAAADPHAMDLAAVIELARALGAAIPEIELFGCDVVDVDERVGLSPPVASAVAEAADAIARRVASLASKTEGARGDEVPAKEEIA